MSARTHVGVVAVLGLVVAAAGQSRPSAQVAAAPEGKIWTGVYSAAQASAGEATYGARCSRCHASDLGGGQVGAAYAPALGGEKFLGSWESRSLARFYRAIKETMPRDAPGSLSESNAAEVLAYVLKVNGFPSGAAALTADTAALEGVTIIPRPGAVKREATNFTAVQAVGCLARGPGSAFVLTGASDAAPARAEGPVIAMDVVAGSQTFRLVSGGAFALDGKLGQRVTVKGLLRRDADEALINLLAVEASGSRCN